MNKLVKQLLDLNELEFGNIKISPEIFNINALIGIKTIRLKYVMVNPKLNLNPGITLLLLLMSIPPFYLLS